MSRQPGTEPREGTAPGADPIETVIVPRARDLGGFEVRRVLPSTQRQMIGPFIFFDQMGPVELLTGAGIDVRPHPHIGLATVTYLLDGSIVHRDSLGTLQTIRPGDVNWMTAGQGIAHSERSASEDRLHPRGLFGMQIWVALPQRHEEVPPAFVHHAVGELPTHEGEGVQARIIAGSLFGRTAPVETYSDLFYADIRLAPGARVQVPAGHEERAAYLVDGTVEVAGQSFEPGRLLVFKPGEAAVIAGVGPARLMLFGGEPMDGPRHLWWNFVSSRPERIEQAKADWRAQRFAAVPGESERIPLPNPPPPIPPL